MYEQLISHQPKLPPREANYPKIPWDDPDFSRRMLREHLTQEHDLASRRTSIIDSQVNWISSILLDSHEGYILDIGCGPGLYAVRLADLGHRIDAMDISPASIAHARAHCQRAGISYRLADITEDEVGTGYNLAMLLYGELNAFSPGQAAVILAKCRDALLPGASILLEAHTFAAIEDIGRAPATWTRYPKGGLFADGPHLVLSEHTWFADRGAVRSDYWVFEQGGAGPWHCASIHQAYTDGQYSAMLEEAGFSEVAFHGPLGEPGGELGALQAITARRGV